MQAQRLNLMGMTWFGENIKMFQDVSKLLRFLFRWHVQR